MRLGRLDACVQERRAVRRVQHRRSSRLAPAVHPEELSMTRQQTESSTGRYQHSRLVLEAPLASIVNITYISMEFSGASCNRPMPLNSFTVSHITCMCCTEIHATKEKDHKQQPIDNRHSICRVQSTEKYRVFF